MDLSICNNMDGARKLMLSEMSDREREVQYYVTYMQNFENKNPPKFIDTENRLVITRGRGAWWAKWVKTVKTYTFQKQMSCGRNVWHGDDS